MANQAAAGAEALANKDYTSAISSYTSALTQLPLSPDYHIKRSTAYQRVSPAQYDLALQDAATAVVLAHKRGKRELIAAAQMRRGIALFGLQRWADAQQCFKWVEQKNAKEPGLSMWQKKVEVELGKAGSQVQASAVTVVELPEDPASQGKEIEVEKKMPAKQKQEVTKAEGVRTPASKIRHDWYQTADTVVVTLLVKGVPKDKATIDLDEHSVSVSFPMPNTSTFDLSLEPLFAPIDTTASSSSVMSTKIEIVLKKATPGQKWPSLEVHADRAQEHRAQDGKPASDKPTKSAVLNTPSRPTGAPAYPTSSRTGAKDWDKLAADLTKKPKTKKDNGSGGGEEGEEGEEGEDFQDDDEGDPVDGFFKKLYAGADPDTRRAMMKSYQESNGTALSTNWSEVGKGKVETTPPEGMEAKTWTQ